MILACLLAIGTFPIGVFATGTADESEKAHWTDEDYDALYVHDADGTAVNVNITSPFFSGLMKDIVRFFDTRTTSFALTDTLEVIRVRDLLLKQVTAPSLRGAPEYGSI